MNININNIFITTVTWPNNVCVLENDFHLYGYSGNKKNIQWSYMSFLVSMAIILLFW